MCTRVLVEIETVELYLPLLHQLKDVLEISTKLYQLCLIISQMVLLNPISRPLNQLLYRLFGHAIPCHVFYNISFYSGVSYACASVRVSSCFAAYSSLGLDAPVVVYASITVRLSDGVSLLNIVLYSLHCINHLNRTL